MTKRIEPEELKALLDQNMSTPQIAAALGISPVTVRSRLLKYFGISPNPRQKINQDEVRAMRQQGMSWQEIHEATGHSKSSLQQAAKRGHHKVIVPPPLDPQAHAEIAEWYVKGASVKGLMQSTGLRRTQVVDIIESQGIRRRTIKEVGTAGVDVDSIEKMYLEGMSQSVIGYKVGLSAATVRRILTEKKVPPHKTIAQELEDTNILNEFMNGASLSELAERYKLRSEPIRSFLLSHGMKIFHGRAQALPIDEVDMDDVFARRRQGETMESIAHSYGVQRSTLAARILRIRKKMSLPPTS